MSHTEYATGETPATGDYVEHIVDGATGQVVDVYNDARTVIVHWEEGVNVDERMAHFPDELNRFDA